MLKRIIPPFLVCILISSAYVFALDPHKAITQYIQDVWLKEQGLPQNSVLNVLQTSDGYLWLGTEEGLARFDGVRFQIFDKSNTPQFTNNYIFALYEDSKSNLWIGTYGGGALRYKNGKFTAFTTKEGLADDRIWTITEDRQGSMWFGTDGGGLSCLKGGRFKTYTKTDGLADNAVVSLQEDRQGTLWIGTRAGLNRLREGKIDLFSSNEGPFQGSVRAILEDSQGQLWIGTGAGLSLLSNGSLKTFTKKDGLPDDRIWCLKEDTQHAIWIGTDGGGLARFWNGTFLSYTTHEGLTNDIVRSILEDREGSIWIGTNGGGLVRFKDLKFTNFTTSEGLSSDFVWPIYEDSSSNLWIGTQERGLNRMSNGKITTFDSKDGLPGDAILSLHEDHNGDLWIGTYGAGLSRFKNGKFQNYTKQNGLAGDLVTSIAEDGQGQLWLGTSGGLSLWKDGTFQSFTTSNGLPNDRIRAILNTSDGLWIGTRGGLSLFNNGKFTNYSTKDGLPNDFISSLHQSRNGNLWIGTVGGGLSLWKNHKFINYSTREGLFNDVVFQILEDNSGRLWMSCNEGIFSVPEKELEDFAAGKISSIHCTPYGTADGMKSGECNGGAQPAGWKTQDGRLWFPTTKGVAMIDPAKVSLNQQLPPVVIEDVGYDDRTLNRSANNAEMRLSPGSGKLEFHYTALSFLVPSNVRFKYRLEGFDDRWIEAGTRRTAYYTNIPPGKYTFHVIACNNDGIWNEAGAAFPFYLQPHFYQTGWFYFLCAVTLLFIGWKIHRYRLGRLLEVERVRTRIATDLHDDIGSGLSQIAILSEVIGRNVRDADSEMKEDLQSIATASRELVDSMSDIVWAVNPVKDHLGDLVQRMRRFAGEILEGRNIQFQFRHPGIEFERNLPPDLRRHVFLIFKETLNNIARHSQCNTVDISLTAEEGFLLLEISDNGKGFDPGSANTGSGLRNMRERARELGGELNIQSAPGAGMTLRLRAPMRRQWFNGDKPT